MLTLTILGPRQAGKTTLAKILLPDYAYSNLEEPEARALAENDPKAYLKQFRGNSILDELQQAGITHPDFSHYCFNGFLPSVYQHSQRPGPAYANYYQTYVERDVRQLIHLKDQSLFEKMLKLMAGRVGQLIDYSALANDVGVDSKTIRNWISILEASYILFKLPPYFENFGKRVIKSPKYYFTEPGLLCFLLGIREPSEFQRDPLVGSIFENLVVVEALKTRYHAGEVADLSFFRDSKGNEVDLLSGSGRNLVAVEIKSASTFDQKQLKGLRRFRDLSPHLRSGTLLYNGQSYDQSDNLCARYFTETHTIFKS